MALLLGAPPAMASHTADHVLPSFGVGALRAEWLADFPVGVEDLGRMGQSGIGMYRTRFRQDEVQQGSAFTAWTRLDNLARQASLNGVTLQPVLINMPLEVYAPPKTASARDSFGSFAEAAARRYGPNGTFWTTCGCPKRAIRVWEVWNEPNIAPYWDVPNPAEYASLLGSTRARLRKADRGARILFGGLAYPSSLSATRLEPNGFLRQVIAAAGWKSFDALALHNYRPNAGVAVDTLIAGTVNTLKTYGGTQASGAPRHQVWLNEFGRPTSLDDPATPEDEAAISEAAQRTWQDAVISRLEANRAAWNLGPLMWYSMRDSHAPTESWLRQGLRRTTSADADGGAKPSWESYTARSSAAGLLNLPVAR
jgi:polysaccharide biosynthesis protein PslG